MGRFTSAPDFDPHQGCGYWWTVVNADKGIKVTDWKSLAAANPKNECADYVGGYCDLALGVAAIGVRTGHPKAREAYDFLAANTKNVLPNRPGNPCFAFSAEPVK